MKPYEKQVPSNKRQSGAKIVIGAVASTVPLNGGAIIRLRTCNKSEIFDLLTRVAKPCDL